MQEREMSTHNTYTLCISWRLPIMLDINYTEKGHEPSVAAMLCHNTRAHYIAVGHVQYERKKWHQPLISLSASHQSSLAH